MLTAACADAASSPLRRDASAKTGKTLFFSTTSEGTTSPGPHQRSSLPKRSFQLLTILPYLWNAEELLQWVQSIMSIKKQGTYAVSQFHLQCKTNAIELTAAGPTVQVQERNSTDPRYPAKVTAVVKRVARYFEDHIEQPREQQQQPEATGDKDALDDSLSELQAYNPSTSASEREEEAVEDGGNTDDPQEGERRSSLVPLHVPDLWNATKAVDSEIDALELALRKMLDTKDSSFDFGAITNPYSIFQVRHTTPFARLAHRNHHFTATSTHPGRNSFFFSFPVHVGEARAAPHAPPNLQAGVIFSDDCSSGRSV